jgi:hypothetical protein
MEIKLKEKALIIGSSFAFSIDLFITLFKSQIILNPIHKAKIAQSSLGKKSFVYSISTFKYFSEVLTKLFIESFNNQLPVVFSVIQVIFLKIS